MVKHQYQSVEALKSKLRLSDKDVAYFLNISSRTLSRRKPCSYLKRHEAEKADALLSVFSLTESVFNNSERAVSWLNKPAKVFRYQTTLKMMNTIEGIEAVETLLNQIEYDVYV